MVGGEQVIYPAGILINKKTRRFHPIVFRPAPRPSESFGEPCRHKSIGHHTEGFDTREEANAEIESQPSWNQTGCVWEWSGEDIPAFSWIF